MTYNAGRAIKAILSSITVGTAKQIVAHSDSAQSALVDLRHNYGQTTSFDAHRERKKMMLMKQNPQEKASDFLCQIRKQVSVQCMHQYGM